MTDFRVGKVTHYYDKIGVAVLSLDADLGTGDKIKFVRGGEELFEQEVGSMQVEHEKIDKAKKGDIVGMKTDQPVKDGAEIFKIT
jgi:translation elongation factor EF-1alpha